MQQPEHRHPIRRPYIHLPIRDHRSNELIARSKLIARAGLVADVKFLRKIATCLRRTAVLVFYTGVMSAGEDVTWFALWSSEAAFPHPLQCTLSNLVSRSLTTKSGLQLGLTEAEFEKIAGNPTQGGSKSVKYNYLCRKKMTSDEINGFKKANNWDVSSDPYFDRMSWIEAWFKNSSASRIEIGEIESY